MSWFFAHAYDLVMAPSEGSRVAAWRTDLLGAARGRVLEVGAGTGANRELYPSGVTELVMTDPDPHMLGRLERKLRRSGHRAQLAAAAVENLPFADGSFDTVVGTLVLCSVRDVTRAVAELRRVLRPGGRYLFLEHVGAPEGTRLARVQRAIEPAWRRVAGNCHLTRRSDRTLDAAGFELDRVVRERAPLEMPMVGEIVRGHALR